MKKPFLLPLTALLCTATALEGLPITASNDTIVAQDQLQTLIKYAANATTFQSQLKGWNSTCTAETVHIRKEWGTLSAEERIAYTDAVRCLQTKSAKSPADWAPGAKTRYDDWVASHIDQTLNIHYTGTFLAWHRWFLWEYEQSLRNECDFNGTHPYWNWGLTAETGLEASPVYDGSATSIGGNGAPVVQNSSYFVLGGGGLATTTWPTGSGGGCVETGPFANMTVNLGPAALPLPGNITEVNPNGPMAYNPRCLKRDLTDYINKSQANSTAIVDTVLRQGIHDFQMTMQSYPGSGLLGIHGGGHYSMGGDPGRDFYVSPGDPAFYLHHGMIDLVWTVWQMLDPENRVWGDNAISGTGTFLNDPPSANTTFETQIGLDYAGSGRNVTMRDIMSTVDGPFCYVYA